VDLHMITALRRPGSRAELALRPGEAVLGGGTWLFAEPQPDLHTIVDLHGLGWTPLELTSAGLTIAATCTLHQLSAWAALPFLHQCCAALAGSFKIWHEATVGGNICLELPAGPMIRDGCGSGRGSRGVARWWRRGTDARRRAHHRGTAHRARTL
jgi:CO/xanthine dehydrogenase FAD-binding subunit